MPQYTEHHLGRWIIAIAWRNTDFGFGILKPSSVYYLTWNIFFGWVRVVIRKPLWLSKYKPTFHENATALDFIKGA